MAKVIQAFRERYHDMKLYNIGEEYPDDDAVRVKYLVSQGYLEPDEPQRPPVLPTIDEFAALPAAEQKKWLADLNIDGDDSNEEKRGSLYTTYLASVNGNADPDA